MSQPYMELRPWCTLVNEITISNILLTVVNPANTLGKTEISDKLYRFVKYHNLTKTGYSPNNLKQYPLFFMLKKTLRLGIPREIYTAQNKTCVAVYGDIAYIIAPKHD